MITEIWIYGIDSKVSDMKAILDNSCKCVSIWLGFFLPGMNLAVCAFIMFISTENPNRHFLIESYITLIFYIRMEKCVELK